MTRPAWRALARRLTTTTTPRPALPFLSPPARPRHFATQPRRGLSLSRIVKWTAVYAATTGSVFAIAYVVQEEGLERAHPTPRSWSHWSRSLLHTALAVVDRPDAEAGSVDWIQATSMAEVVVRRLEGGPDGESVKRAEGRDRVDIPRSPHYALADFFTPSSDDNDGDLGYDVSACPDEWRRGYHQALMLLARGAENLEGAMTHTQTGRTYRREYIIGPSHPNPRPLPAGERGAAPREHECVPAFDPPSRYYLRVLTARGFSPRQRLDAALACAAYYEYSRQHALAEGMHRWALDIAVASSGGAGGSSSSSSSSATTPSLDPATLTIPDNAPPPSANVIDALTALATFRAARGDAAAALPMLISLLRARRRCPPPAPAPLDVPDLPGFSPAPPATGTLSWLRAVIAEPPYPPPPPDGSAPPVRDALARCREAALGLYIGEILFSAHKTDDGLGWTREAVDAAEEQLRGLELAPVVASDRSQDAAAADGPRAAADPARRTCRQCLATGLNNWTRMAKLLAADEAAQQPSSSSSPLSNPLSLLWKSPPPLSKGDSDTASDADAGARGGRWADELRVIEARERRTRDLLRDSDRPEAPRLSALVIA
jgi:hypothetical protein